MESSSSATASAATNIKNVVTLRNVTRNEGLHIVTCVELVCSSFISAFLTHLWRPSTFLQRFSFFGVATARFVKSVGLQLSSFYFCTVFVVSDVWRLFERAGLANCTTIAQSILIGSEIVVFHIAWKLLCRQCIPFVGGFQCDTRAACFSWKMPEFRQVLTVQNLHCIVHSFVWIFWRF